MLILSMLKKRVTYICDIHFITFGDTSNYCKKIDLPYKANTLDVKLRKE